jgi:hypothetical protein
MQTNIAGLKMAAPLRTCMKEEKPSVICFSIIEGVTDKGSER